jgi:hypothetical protein
VAFSGGASHPLGLTYHPFELTYHPFRRPELGYFGQNCGLTDDKLAQPMTSGG